MSKVTDLDTYKFPAFCQHKSKGFYWFRIFGYGYAIKDIRINPLLFSQRMKITGKTIGNYHISFLTPSTEGIGLPNYPKYLALRDKITFNVKMFFQYTMRIWYYTLLIKLGKK